MPETAEMELPPEAAELQRPRETEAAGESRGARIIVEKYHDKRFPIMRKHYTIEMTVPEGIPLNELEFANLTYKGEPVTEGHWRNYAGHGPHQFQLRGRWIFVGHFVGHRDCLKYPEEFKALWRRVIPDAS